MASEFVVKNTYNSDHRSPAHFIWSHVRRHKLVLFFLIVGASSNAFLAAFVPYFIGLAFDALTNITDETTGTILLAVGGILFVTIVRSILQFIRNFSAEIFSQRIERDVRDELYASLLGKSMSFHDMQPVGDIMARVTNDVREMNFMMNPGFNLIIGSGMFLLTPVIAAPLIKPQFIIIPIGFVILHVIIQYRFIRSLHPIAQDIRTRFGKMNARLAEALEGLQVVKGSAQEDNESAYFNQLADDVRDHYIEQGEIEARYLSLLLLGLAFVVGFLQALQLYNAGIVTTGEIVSFFGLLYLFGFPVFTSLFALSRVASGYASAGRILSIIVSKTDLDRNPKGHSASINGAVSFKNVDFSYRDGQQVLSDVSFDIQPGQTVAIVGQTGSGKSTITKLMNRIYDTDSGEVLIDGIPVRDWSLESLRSQISIIEQDIFLFSRSIADNIAFGNEDATQEQIESAAQKAQAHDFIFSFPEGYETVIGQRGVTLSGGQRQRLALARAFQTDPPILILDDSTSAIDSATEDKIQQAIWSAAEGRTTILITHRLSQIRWADHIIVIRNGQVAAQGSHDQLMETSPAYRRIFARYDAPSTPTDLQPVPSMGD